MMISQLPLGSPSASLLAVVQAVMMQFQAVMMQCRSIT